MPPTPATRLADLRHRPYTPYGAALELWRATEPEVVLAGSAGTGKSRSCLERLWFTANRYPGCRQLMVRKTRASLTESGLATLEAHVIPEGHPCLGIQRRLRQSYRLPNGSEIVVAGMDCATKVMSTEFDVIFVQEATELTEEDWEALSTRLRNGRTPYQQLMGDCNPSSPSHWIKLRANAGKLRLLEGRHEDNPVLFDPERQEWTEAGKRYLARLDELTGPRYQRLRLGKWVASEGQIYENWDPNIHLVKRRPVPWPRLWSIDFGFTNPFVWQNWALDPDGRMFLVQELYQTGLLVEDAAREILRLTKGQPEPLAILCDHDAEDRATLERHLGKKTTAAKKLVSPGIQAVQARLRPAGDGRPRLMLFREALVRRDPALVEGKKPTCTAEEVEGYCWNPNLGGGKEVPIKDADHGVDAMRYAVAHVDGLGRRRLVFY